MQTNMTTARFAIVYEGTSVNDGTMDAQQLARAVLAMGDLVDFVSGTINGDRAFASLSVRAIHPGSIELQFALDVAFNMNLQMAVDVTLNASDIKKVLFGGSALGGAGGVFMLFKRFRGRSPRVVSEVNDDILRIGPEEDGTLNLVHRIGLHLYEQPETRSIVGRIVQPLIDLDLDKLVIRDSEEKLEEVTKEDASLWRIEELENRELEYVDMIREELRAGFGEITGRIEVDMPTMIYFSKSVMEINERLSRIEQRLNDRPNN